MESTFPSPVPDELRKPTSMESSSSSFPDFVRKPTSFSSEVPFPDVVGNPTTSSMKTFCTPPVAQFLAINGKSSSSSLSIPVTELAKIAPKIEPYYEDHPDTSDFTSIPAGFENLVSTNADDIDTVERSGGEERTSPSRNMGSDLNEEELLSEYYRLSQLFVSSFQSTPAGFGDCQYWPIVPTKEDNRSLTEPVTKRRKKTNTPRSAEMVRVTSLGECDRRYFRDLMRKTRATYDSLRVRVGSTISKLPEAKRHRPDLKAATLMMDQNLWTNRDKRVIGAIPGINVGDIFFFRIELCVIGLHGQVQGGIDYVPANRSSTGEPICTSIVMSGGYEDDEDSGNVMVYTGHGGRSHNMTKHSIDQTLTGGNLALERSMHYGIEIRVIRGFKVNGGINRLYVYDGLYRVVKFWQETGKSGFSVFKYKLVRVAGQDEMGTVILKFADELKQILSSSLAKDPPPGYLSTDISAGKERIPVPLFNDIDEDRDPLLFDYLVQPIYPATTLSAKTTTAGGCSCALPVTCSKECHCISKNGGEFPYDSNGILITGKPLIYECSSRCSCPPYCWNRVSQHGLRTQLEVFRSKQTGWGVRALDFIRAGSFVCEFTGIVQTETMGNSSKENNYSNNNGGGSTLFPHRFSNRWFEWGDIPGVQHVRSMLPGLPPLRFSIDVSRGRNVGCYLSHNSVSPNLFVEFVLYDHDDVRYPHLMVFALENIPPLRELSVDYGVADGLLATTTLSASSPPPLPP